MIWGINRFTPKTKIIEVPVYRIKEVEKIKEVPVYKGERIIEKEKIVYTDKKMDLFIIHQIDDDTFVMNFTGGENTEWNVSVANTETGQGLFMKRFRKTQYIPNYTATCSTVGFWR